MFETIAFFFDENTTQLNVDRWSQGAFKTFGKERIRAFGEAAIFSSQLAGSNKRKMGMNNKVAPENYSTAVEYYSLVGWEI